METGEGLRNFLRKGRPVNQLCDGTGFAHIHHKQMLLARIDNNAASPFQGYNPFLHLHHTAARIDIIDLHLRVGMAVKPVICRETYFTDCLDKRTIPFICQKLCQFFFYRIHSQLFLSVRPELPGIHGSFMMRYRVSIRFITAAIGQSG